MLQARLASAAVLAPVVIVATWAGGLVFAAMVALTAAWCAIEFCGLLTRGGYRPARVIIVLGALLLVAAPTFPGYRLGSVALGLIVIGPGLYVLWRRDPLREGLANWAQSSLAATIVGWTLSQGIVLRMASGDATIFGFASSRGLALALVALTCTWISDTAAYAVGRMIGKHPFFPAISPRKSIEGAIGGIIAPLIVGMIWANMLEWSLVFGALLGGVAGVAAIAGDLLESMLKRAVGVKDAGAIIPGHGGLLDRVDSLLLVLVAVAIMTGEVWP